jgi:hypothetical protein
VTEILPSVSETALTYLPKTAESVTSNLAISSVVYCLAVAKLSESAFSKAAIFVS